MVAEGPKGCMLFAAAIYGYSLVQCTRGDKAEFAPGHVTASYCAIIYGDGIGCFLCRCLSQRVASMP